MSDDISIDQVVQYLTEHPDFFDAHPELLTSLTVMHAHGGRAVSLVERQVELLRDKNKSLEMRLAELVRIGQENDAIADKLQHWTRDLLRVRALSELPERLVEQLENTFNVPQVALRIWRVAPEFGDLTAAALVAPDILTLADSFKQPYCGPNAEFRAAAWLPGAGLQTRSIALLPLRVGAAPEAFGLLVLGSPDPARFQAGMGTTFLERIAEIASAALSRLLP